jgi:uncharacterized protein (UPF0261 family)
MQRTIAIVATLDTKAAEVAYIRDLIEARGHRALVFDAGVLGEAPFAPDVTRDAIARAAGMSIEEVRGLPNEGQAIFIMAEGAARVVRGLYDEGRLDAILGVGGSMGTSLGLAAMRALPVGVPKLMVSTIGFSPLVTPDAVAKDQVMMQVPVDLYGLNAINRHSLDAAAAAICAMAEGAGKIVVAKPLVAVTTRGIMHYLQWIKPALETRGYEVVVIHAVGTVGGGTFEDLVRQGLFSVVLDLCTGEVIEELNGGALRAGPGRLEAAGEMGIPQIVAPGCMEFFHWPGPSETAPPDRKVHIHNPLVVGVKATAQEMVAAAEVMAQKLNRAKGPVKVLIPLLGWDLHDQPGHVFHDPEGRAAFLDTLKRCLHPRVELMELNCHINDQPFAEAVLQVLDKTLAISSTNFLDPT